MPTDGSVTASQRCSKDPSGVGEILSFCFLCAHTFFLGQREAQHRFFRIISVSTFSRWSNCFFTTISPALL